MNHVAIEHKKCERPHCPICEGGLFMCRVCGCAEGATTDDCPGIRVTDWAIQQIYDGKLNFRDGMWRYELCAQWNSLRHPHFDPVLYERQKEKGLTSPSKIS